MLTINQASVVGQDQLKAGVVEMFMTNSVVLQDMPFIPMSGNAYSYLREKTLPGAATRAVNASWVESVGDFERRSESLKIYGGEAHVDRFIEKTMGPGFNLGSHMAAQTQLKIKAVTFKINSDLINGDSALDPNAMDGIKKRMPTTQVVDASASGTLDVNLDDASRNLYLDLLDELIARVPGGASALYMNSTMLAKTRSVARRLGFHATDRNEFGQVVDYYGSVPLRDIGKNADGTDIIPNTEPNGAGTPVNETTSVYAVGYGEDRLAGITNGGIDAYRIGGQPNGEMESKPAYGVRIEAYMGLVDHTARAAARLRRLK